MQRYKYKSVKRLRVLIACSGLGHVSRGFETASAKIAENLAGMVDVTVARGGGPWRREVGIRLPCIQRFGRFAGSWLRIEDEAAYILEQRSFAPSAYALARLGHFDIVHLHDPALTNAFWHGRRRLGGQFSIVFTNSGPTGPEHLRRPDFIQSVTPIDATTLTEAGFSPEQRAMVPYGVDQGEPPIRAFVDGPLRRIIGVGVLNDNQKGFSTAIRALASLPDASLRLVGQRDHETSALEALGRNLLGGRFSTATLARGQVADELMAADAFILPSRSEGFCLAVLEALESGLPCVVSDIPVLRWLVGDAAVLVPPDRPDEWARALAALTVDVRRDLSRRARTRANDFHWTTLAPRYLDMYRRAASCGRRTS